MPGPTFFDLAASIDRVLHRNTQNPDQTLTVGTYAVTPLMHTLMGDATGGLITLNLQTAVGLSGMRFTFKKVDSSTNLITVNALGGQTIDGSPSFDIGQLNEVLEIESDGANWKIISNLVSTGSPSFANLDIKSIIKTDNDFSSLDPVPGTTIPFTTTRDGTCFFSCSAYTSGLSLAFYSGSIGINVDGTPYTLFVDAQSNGAGGDATFNMGYAGSIGVPLTAGVHTAYVFVTQSVIGFQATANNPMTLSVIYPTLSGATAAAAALGRQEAENTTSGTVTESGAIGTYADVPLTTLTIDVIASQVVYFSGEGHAFRDDAQLGRQNTQLGLSVDGVDYDGTAADTATLGGFLSCPVTVTKAVTLGPGSHTIKLRLRRHQAGNSASAILLADATYPIRLTAIYTVPTELVQIVTGTGLEAEGTRKVDGDYAVTTAVTVVPGTTTSFTVGVAGKTIVSISGSIFAAANTANDYTATIGIRIDGTTDFFFPFSDGVTGWDPTGHNGAEGLHLGGTIPLDLAVGAHTIDMIIAASDGAGGAVWTLNANATKPACVDVIYPVFVAIPGNMTASVISATGATVDAFVTIMDITSSIAVDGFGTIVNTGAQSMDVQETGVDQFGPTTGTQITVVLAGNSLPLAARNSVGAALTPYSEYKLEVRSTTPGSPTNYSLKFLSEVAP